MKLYRRQPTNKAKPTPGVHGVETFSVKGLDAAREMLVSSDHQAARKSYSAALIKESQDLGAYIVRKRTSTVRRKEDEPSFARSA